MKNPFLFCFTKSFSSHFFVPEEYEKLTIRSEEKIDTSAKISLFLIHEKNLFPNKSSNKNHKCISFEPLSLSIFVFCSESITVIEEAEEILNFLLIEYTIGVQQTSLISCRETTGDEIVFSVKS